MFYPKCPVCGSDSESAESDTFDLGTRRMGQYLSMQSLQGHPHPALKVLQIGLSLGRQVYKRAPGCGEKRCKACGHKFR